MICTTCYSTIEDGLSICPICEGEIDETIKDSEEIKNLNILVEHYDYYQEKEAEYNKANLLKLKYREINSLSYWKMLFIIIFLSLVVLLASFIKVYNMLNIGSMIFMMILFTIIIIGSASYYYKKRLEEERANIEESSKTSFIRYVIVFTLIMISYYGAITYIPINDILVVLILDIIYSYPAYRYSLAHKNKMLPIIKKEFNTIDYSLQEYYNSGLYNAIPFYSTNPLLIEELIEVIEYEGASNIKEALAYVESSNK